MRHLVTVALAAGLAFATAGCGGDGLLRTHGRLLKGGQPFIPKEGEFIEITFVPIPPDGKPPADFYYADVDQTTGTFQPAGKNRKGMPPGKYRVAVELMKKKKDQFRGKFDAEKSPFVFDVDSRTAEIVIDLDKPPK
jgi:hypothetical protein